MPLLAVPILSALSLYFLLRQVHVCHRFSLAHHLQTKPCLPTVTHLIAVFAQRQLVSFLFFLLLGARSSQDCKRIDAIAQIWQRHLFYTLSYPESIEHPC